MKINWTRGCVVTCLSIDKKDYDDYTDDEKGALRHHILDWLLHNEDKVSTEDLLELMLEMAGEYECSDHPCECCGDWVDSYEMEI